MICRVILLLLLCDNLYAQTFNGAPFQGTGNTGVALKSIYSITNNAAGLTGLSSAEAAIAYQANFIASELSTQVIYVALPIKKANAVGLAFHRYGLASVSSILTMSGAYVRSFGDLFSTSISINYHSFSVKDYGNDQTYSVDLGGQFPITEQITIGAIIRNISNEMFAEDIDQYLPREIALGIAFDISEQIYVSTDVYYNPFQNITVRTGASYEIDKMVALRIGASNGPTQFYGGIGLRIRNIKIDCSSSYHTQLGTSPQIALSYAF